MSAWFCQSDWLPDDAHQRVLGCVFGPDAGFFPKNRCSQPITVKMPRDYGGRRARAQVAEGAGIACESARFNRALTTLPMIRGECSAIRRKRLRIRRLDGKIPTHPATGRWRDEAFSSRFRQVRSQAPRRRQGCEGRRRSTRQGRGGDGRRDRLTRPSFLGLSETELSPNVRFALQTLLEEVAEAARRARPHAQAHRPSGARLADEDAMCPSPTAAAPSCAS